MVGCVQKRVNDLDVLVGFFVVRQMSALLKNLEAGSARNSFQATMSPRR